MTNSFFFERMLAPCLTVFSALWWLSSGCHAQTSEQNFLERRTLNEGFENGLASWNSTGSVEVIPWNQLPPDPAGQSDRDRFYLTVPDDSLNLVSNNSALKLTGAANIYQYAAVNGKADFQLLLCNARKRRIDGSGGELGWAGYGVTYFDGSWKQLASQEQQIFDTKFFSIDSPPGYSQSSQAFRIPDGAVHSILWLANDGANTELYADDVGLFNLFIGPPIVDASEPLGERFTQDPTSVNLVLNSGFVSSWKFDYPDPTNLEIPGRFTSTGNDAAWQRFGTRFAPLWGFFPGEFQLGTGEAAYWQNVSLQEGASYELENTFIGRGQFTFGIDIYDANWNYLETQAIESDPFAVGLPFDTRQKTIQFTAPQSAVNASVWIWFGPTNRSIANNLDMKNTVLRPVAAQ